MICERPYLAPVHERDPEEVCFACAGRGFQKWFDSDMGWERLTCRVCDGVATEGRFVVRVITKRFKFEFTFQTSSLPRAIAKAESAARHLAGRKAMGAEPLCCEVIYMPHDLSQKDEIAATVVITPRDRIAA